MTPEQKIKHAILVLMEASLPETVTADNIDDLYRDITEDSDDYYDAENEFRSGDVDTDIEAEYSRNYESRSVGAKMPDGSWVGWTYWYGGGKHGSPWEIDWMGKAYDLNMVEETKTIVVKTFTKA